MPEQVLNYKSPTLLDPVASLNVRLDDIARRHNLKVEIAYEDTEHDLFLRLPNGTVIALVEDIVSIDCRKTYGPDILAASEDIDRNRGSAALVRSVLAILGLDHTAVVGLCSEDKNSWLKDGFARRRILAADPAV